MGSYKSLVNVIIVVQYLCKTSEAEWDDQILVLFVMSRVTKRKHVTKEVLEELVEPVGDQLIVKVRDDDRVDCILNSIIVRVEMGSN